MWFVWALVSTLAWGIADIFYKKGTDETDGQSHLKIAVWVGMVMGITAIALLPFAESGFSVVSLLQNAVLYAPASLAYIISMVIGYAGLRYLELSIISPIQNASGAFSMIAMIIYFLVTGGADEISEEYSILDFVGTPFIIAGVIALAIIEKKLSSEAGDVNAKNDQHNRKYRLGVLALLFPILYCIFDTIGTAADGIILDEEKGLGLGEIDVLVLYGLTFFAAGLIVWIYMLIKNGRPYNPFTKKDITTKGTAAVAEEFGQVFYVYAMAAKPLVAAPMIASYCIVSVILSRIFIKEKLKASQYACVISVIIGIVLLGISEGIGEAAD
ncbi:MAG: hypothetical protein K6G45_05225 [Lachnospiraceae bacterium]|nr:hypothetical protein [Lachnospiraceae bacterium]MCR5767876.1 hypothetical protein [Lachnospiraceae bacterium]